MKTNFGTVTDLLFTRAKRPEHLRRVDIFKSDLGSIDPNSVAIDHTI
ncbi:MAG: hypothetical protein ABNH49_04535 [Hyphomonas sp.]